LVAFHASVVATLTPGQVFFQKLPNPDSTNWVDAIVSMDEFVARAHATC
jgi:hypothetical protein